MTNQELISYYANLLPSQYVTQPNAYQTIQDLAYIALMPQDGGIVYDMSGNVVTDPFTRTVVTALDIDDAPILPLAIAPAFDIQTAVGQQLQFLAEAVGITNAGFNLLGNWVVLTDAQFRQLLQAGSGRNYLRATLPAIIQFIKTYFSTSLQVTDDLYMHMTYYYSEVLGSDPVTELFITQGLLPRPLGVGMNVIGFGYDYFGFLEDTNADTFGDVNVPATGGYMPEILI